MRLSRMTISGTLVLACLAGCSSDLQKTNALLVSENEDLRAQLADRNAALAESQQALTERDARIARLEMEAQYQQPALAQVTGFEQIDNVSASYEAGQVTVEVESDVLFSSGKTALKTVAKSSLNDVSTVLVRSYPDHLIRIEGHTDSDPIRKSGHASNYHLGFERAYAVREYLISRGVPPARISLASYGPDLPRQTKPESRRVQIVVYR